MMCRRMRLNGWSANGTRGDGSGIIYGTVRQALSRRLSAAANTGVRRTGTAYVGYQALIVDQAGTAASGCPATSSYTTAGGTGAFVIVPNDQRCGWSADRSMSGEDWSSVPVPIRGVGTAA